MQDLLEIPAMDYTGITESEALEVSFLPLQDADGQPEDEIVRQEERTNIRYLYALEAQFDGRLVPVGCPKCGNYHMVKLTSPFVVTEDEWSPEIYLETSTATCQFTGEDFQYRRYRD